MDTTIQIVLAVATIILLAVASVGIKYLNTKRKQVADIIRNEKLEKTVNWVHQITNQAVIGMEEFERVTGKDIPDTIQEHAKRIEKLTAKVREVVSSDVAKYIETHTLEDFDKWLETVAAYHLEGRIQVARQQREQQAMQAAMQGMNLGGGIPRG